MIMMKLQPIGFDKIKSGKQTLEIRLNDEKRQQVNVGDLVIFKKEPDCYDGVVAKVVDKKFFKTFLQMAETLPLKDMGFEGLNAEAVDREMHKYYSKSDEEKYGVVVFKIEVTN